MLDTPPWRSAGLTRKAQALAYISWCLVELGRSPSIGEIANALAVSPSRAKGLVRLLAHERMIERQAGAQRGISVPGLVDQLALGRLKAAGWTINHDARTLSTPSPQGQLPVIARLEYLPPIDGDGEQANDDRDRRRARGATGGAPGAGATPPEGEGQRAA
jgi:SOS-response transcriptional repressor LexA